MNDLTVKKIAVIGAGSWGTAIAGVLSGKGLNTVLWAHNIEHVAALEKDRENKKYLSGFMFPPSLKVTANLEEAVRGATVVCMVVPSHGFRSVFEKLTPFLEAGTFIVSAVKGIENSSLMTMTQVMGQTLGKDLNRKNLTLSVLSGPSFAKEVAQGLPTLVTIGCDQLDKAKILQKIFVSERFRVYAAQDMIGLEISAALKNIVAIAAGICDGLGYGLNSRAALITRGLAEITRMGVAMGADPLTFSGLSGLGDLVLTCTGDLSRNRTVGLKLGQGKKLPRILEEMEMVAEGVKTTKSVHDLVQRMGVDMPILEQVYQILYEEKDCSKAVNDLLTRELKVE
ncbi:MAG: NAD(P)-dependent glycerol-3-phosphate dehydrogenase [Proteobacteria bacterium]|nr:NAD(P)-dependent glycerol-3-phosphate dehydrogenase [Pseudomonadota bacterium]MBU1231438.1 NAD(P)-dependent glycerol-3-phosphate dehydrogenase [Pseudomonadota bacterium]MBU1420212.1 NAD(P)-dependent glycerol-3-phosphate dehydrogenase [Pseudomonadota bacterium]MBU1455541.1 NAD(P)-dependent glycerol-3-phosphate dehydrogenase [Pseudomonadota bacterium]